MSEKRPQRPRSVASKKAQTMNANEARERNYGFTFEWLRTLYLSGMQQKQWLSRAEAARWLTKESEAVLPLRFPALLAWTDASRGYSRKFYERIAGWEKEFKLPYRSAGEAAPCPDPDACYTVFDRNDDG